MTNKHHPMFTINNYFEKVKGIDRHKLPENLQEVYDFVKEVTDNHSTWDYYHSDMDIKATVDQYLANLSNLPAKPTAPKKAPAKKATAAVSEATAYEIAKKFIYSSVMNGQSVAQINKSMMGSGNDRFHAYVLKNYIHVTQVAQQKVAFKFPLQKVYNEILAEKPAPAPKKVPAKKAAPKPKTAPRKRIDNSNAQPVEKIEEEVRFIKRYILMHDKVKTDTQLLNFINALQKAILEKRIRKTSPYASQISYMQENLIRVYNKMGKSIHVKISEDTLTEFMAIAGSEKIRLSVAYMKRYMGIQGKQITKDKAERLYNLIAGAINKRKLPANDPYMERMKKVLQSLRTFMKSAKKTDTLHIHQAVLNGIHDALNGCGCGCGGKKCGHGGLHGLELPENAQQALPPDAVVNSMDFAKMQFKTLGFTGKWLELIGDPSGNFTAMVFGKPKMGKSYLCIDFASYLAQNHGKVLYVAKEEGLDYTLQEKLKASIHPNLFVTGELQADLSPYDFIFLDSVSRLGLTPDQLRSLKAQYPNQSFIYVFQSTKEGGFRGENSFQHDVDVVIEVPEKGKAVQMGRFNQGGNADIFMCK
jgi:hypothetical protein